MIVKLLTEHHLEFQSLKGGCRGSSQSTHVKMAHCWKSHVTAHIFSDAYLGIPHPFQFICDSEQLGEHTPVPSALVFSMLLYNAPVICNHNPHGGRRGPR